MSTQQQHERIPPLTLGWRLKMSLGDIPVPDMAEQLGVSRQTLSRWMADKGAPPKRGHLVAWALATDVSLEWLERGGGAITPTGTRDDGGSMTTHPYVDHIAA